MDGSHRAALLAASCLHPPVPPRTRVPVARDEREPQRTPAAKKAKAAEAEAKAKAEGVQGVQGVQDNLDPERERSSSVYTDCEECIDFTKMYLSNQEYYLKLEELKNAHLETMAKLESMYQTKLHLKGVQPLSSMDAAHSMSCRNTWTTCKDLYQISVSAELRKPEDEEVASHY